MVNKKQLSQGEISEYASTFLQELTSGSELTEFSERFSAEPASTRRDVLEAVSKRNKGPSKQNVEAARVAEFLEKVLDIGSAQKPNFIASYYKSVFDCAINLTGQNSELSCKHLFMGLVAPTYSKEVKGSSRIGAPAIMLGLADIRGINIGLNASLGDETLRKKLGDSFELWSILIPEMAAKGKSRVGLSSAALSGFLIIVANRTVLDSAIKLSLPIIIDAVGIVPAEFQASSYAGLEVAIRDVPQHGNGNEVLNLQEHRYKSDDVLRFSSAVQSFMKELDTAIEKKIKNLGEENRRLERRNDELSGELADYRNKLSSLSDQKSRLQDGIEQQKLELATVRAALTNAKSELDQYIQSHDALAETSGNVERDVSAKVRRDFNERAGGVLMDIRHYLEQLQGTPDIKKVRLAVSSFNSFSKMLRNQNFITAQQLPNIDNTIQDEDPT